MFKLMDKKIITILRIFVLNWPYESIRCQNNLFTFNYCKLQNKSVISGLEVIKLFFMLNSTEHEISIAHKKLKYI